MIYKPANTNVGNVCHWQRLLDGKWRPGCLLTWTTEMHPFDSGNMFCPQCGKRITLPCDRVPHNRRSEKNAKSYEYIGKGEANGISVKGLPI